MAGFGIGIVGGLAGDTIIALNQLLMYARVYIYLCNVFISFNS